MKGDRGFMHYSLAICGSCIKPHIKRSWRPLRRQPGVCYDCGNPVVYAKTKWGVYKKFMEMPRIALTQQM
jgi:hypothetical protein